MNIIVCAKQVPDTTEVRLDPKTGTLIREGVPSIMNPDDKAGLEAALKIKDQNPDDVTVKVMTMGLPQAEDILREALAMGADEAYLITDPKFGGADTWATSSTIAASIDSLGDYDLIITGRQAIDGDTAQVGPQIAEHLGIPNVSYAEDIKVEDDGTVVVQRQYEDSSDILKVKMPALITALGDMNEPRYMTPGGVHEAFATEIKRIGRNDIEIDDSNIGLKGSPTRVLKSFPKALKEPGQVVNYNDDQQSADFVIEKLKEKFII